MNPFLRLARVIGRQSWLPTAGPRFATVDAVVQRWTGGRLSLVRLAGLTSVLLTTTGRRTGQPRSLVLLAVPDSRVPGSLILVASNFGKPGHPAWSANLLADPHATVHLRGHVFDVTATLLDGAERAVAWAAATAVWPAFDVYAERADRHIRVFRLSLR